MAHVQDIPGVSRRIDGEDMEDAQNRVVWISRVFPVRCASIERQVGGPAELPVHGNGKDMAIAGYVALKGLPVALGTSGGAVGMSAAVLDHRHRLPALVNPGDQVLCLDGQAVEDQDLLGHRGERRAAEG